MDPSGLDGERGAPARSARLRRRVGGPKAKNENFRAHLTATQAAIPSGARSNTRFSVFVYGHTHKEQAAYSPFAADAEWKPTVYNDGAWQRTAKPPVWCTIA